MSISLAELATQCGALIQGGNPQTVIHSAADITSAKTGQVTQLTHSRYNQYLLQSTASACFVGPSSAFDGVPEHLALLICTDPEMAFIKAVNLLHTQARPVPGIARQAAVAQSAVLGEGVFVGPFAVIAEHADIGEGCQIFPGAYIGQHVTLGKNCKIYPYAVVYDKTVIGDNVTIHSGAVIGADGFGYKYRDSQHVKVPQIGNVVIEDNVEIGANTCIDRGALGSTRIGLGSKLDNLVQIGHNNQIGRHVILCGQVGVSGSCTIQDYAILAGSAGIADHVTIGKGAVVMARAGVAADVEPGSQVFGSPAKAKRTAYKEQAALAKLPEMLKTVKQLQEEVRRLSKIIETD